MKRPLPCQYCQGPRTYFEQFDMYGCTACDVWVEKICKCAGETCEYYPHPPSKPSEASPLE